MRKIIVILALVFIDYPVTVQDTIKQSDSLIRIEQIQNNLDSIKLTLLEILNDTIK